MNLYISVFDYKNAPTGQETASLLGNLLRVSTGGVAQGGTSLPVTPNTTMQLNQYDTITIFDGSSSESVQVTANTASGASSVPITATAYAHAAGTPLCSDGVSGSLAQAIIEGSAHVERYCEQELLAATYSETLYLRTMDANVTNDGSLSIRPMHFPVSAVSALSIQTSVATVIQLDATQAILQAKARLIKVPVVKQQGTGASLLQQYAPLDQTAEGWVTFTYTAGYTYASLPWDIKQAAILLTSNVLSDRQNPSGAADQRLGQKQLTMYLRGDQSGETTFEKRAYQLLERYKRGT